MAVAGIQPVPSSSVVVHATQDFTPVGVLVPLEVGDAAASVPVQRSVCVLHVTV